MKLNELLETVGFDNVSWQNLDNCADSLNFNRRKGTKITFGTEESLNTRGTVKQGIILWIDRDKVKAALAKAEVDSMNTASSPTALKPCPFCGVAKLVEVRHSKGTVLHPHYYVHCDNCGARTGGTDQGTHVEEWNTRPAISQPVTRSAVECIKRIREIIGISNCGLKEAKGAYDEHGGDIERAIAFIYKQKPWLHPTQPQGDAMREALVLARKALYAASIAIPTQDEEAALVYEARAAVEEAIATSPTTPLAPSVDEVIRVLENLLNIDAREDDKTAYWHSGHKLLAKLKASAHSPVNTAQPAGSAKSSKPKQWFVCDGKRSNQSQIVTPEGDEWNGVTTSDARYLVKLLNERERRLCAALPQPVTGPSAGLLPVPDGWFFSSSDFSMRTQGYVSFKRTPDEAAKWFELSDAMRDLVPLYVNSSQQPTFPEAWNEAVQKTTGVGKMDVWDNAALAPGADKGGA